jgi:hypothetical protein
MGTMGNRGVVFVNTSKEVLSKGNIKVSTNSLVNPVGGKPAMVGVAEREVGRIRGPILVRTLSEARWGGFGG